MSPIPFIPLPTEQPATAPVTSFDRTQINQINAFFSSTAGAVTFTIVWVACVLSMLLVALWTIATLEEENRTNPEKARERAEMGAYLMPSTDIPELPIKLRMPKFASKLTKTRFLRLW